MSNSRILPLGRLVVRQFSNTAVKQNEVVSPKFQKLKENQKRFGVEDDIPVHLKGGRFDRLLYQFTVVLTLAGVGLSLETFYRLIQK